jgi:hypothetical protein
MGERTGSDVAAASVSMSTVLMVQSDMRVLTDMSPSKLPQLKLLLLLLRLRATGLISPRTKSLSRGGPSGLVNPVNGRCWLWH